MYQAGVTRTEQWDDFGPEPRRVGAHDCTLYPHLHMNARLSTARLRLDLTPPASNSKVFSINRPFLGTANNRRSLRLSTSRDIALSAPNDLGECILPGTAGRTRLDASEPFPFPYGVGGAVVFGVGGVGLIVQSEWFKVGCK